MTAKAPSLAVIWGASIGLALLLVIPAISQDASKDAKQDSSTKRETVAKPLTEKQIKKKEAALKKELETPWKKWLNEDVTYIITDEERKAFKQLNTDEEREQFVEQFWLRRDPTPDTVENEFKEEHYRRIAYANEHYASGVPGWKMDRGRIYITFGPPDEIDSHPSGGTYERPDGRRRRRNHHLPVRRLALSLHRRHRQRHHDRVRRYHHDRRIPHDDGPVGKGRVDLRSRRRPHAGRADGPERQDGPLQPHRRHAHGRAARRQCSRPATTSSIASSSSPSCSRRRTVKFKDLEAAISTRITYNILPMQVRIDYVRVTESSVLANITVQFENRDLQFQAKDGVQKSVVNLLGRVSTMTRRPVTTFEKPLEIECAARHAAEIRAAAVHLSAVRSARARAGTA